MYYYFMSPLRIHGVKRAFVVSLFLTALFLMIYGGLVSMYWLYPSGAVIAILIVTGIVIFGGLSDLYFYSWGRYQKYRKMTGQFLNIKVFIVDPVTQEIFERPTGCYDEEGISVRKPLVASFSPLEIKRHPGGQTAQAWLAANGDLILLEKED